MLFLFFVFHKRNLNKNNNNNKIAFTNSSWEAAEAKMKSNSL